MANSLKIGSVVAIAGLIAFLFIRIEKLKDARVRELQDIYRLEWLLAAKEAENDTLRVIAKYSKPETVIVSQVRIVVDTLEGRIDTVYEDIPVISGSIEIDTTRQFGPGNDPMAVRIWGRIWYPEEYSGRNQLLIHPVAGKPPYLPVTKSCPTKSIGIMMAFDSNSELMGLMRFDYKRLSVYGGYSIPGKYYLTGFGFKIF